MQDTYNGRYIHDIRRCNTLIELLDLIAHSLLVYCRYRKLSLKYHPDKNKAPGADNKFDEVGEAYDVLCERKCLHVRTLQVFIFWT